MFIFFSWQILRKNLNFHLRYYVHVSRINEFLDLLVKHARSLVVGNPFDLKTNMGPVVSKQHYDKVMSYINQAVSSGCEILCGETVE